MKMAVPDFEALRAAIKPLDTEARRETYRNGEFPRAELVKDLDTRYRWDLFWAVGGLRKVLPGHALFCREKLAYAPPCAALCRHSSPVQHLNTPH